MLYIITEDSNSAREFWVNDMILCPHDNWIEAYEQLKNMRAIG